MKSKKLCQHLIYNAKDESYRYVLWKQNRPNTVVEYLLKIVVQRAPPVMHLLINSVHDQALPPGLPKAALKKYKSRETNIIRAFCSDVAVTISPAPYGQCLLELSGGLSVGERIIDNFADTALAFGLKNKNT